MILASKLLGYNDQDPTMKTFEVVIQLGAILAIALVYWRRILDLLGIKKIDSGGHRMAPGKKLNLLHVIIGIAPALIVAFFARDFIKSLFSASTVIWALVAGGVFMIFAEWFNKSKAKITAETIDDLSYKQVFLIGIYQILSVLWPGFSRSGSTIMRRHAVRCQL